MAGRLHAAGTDAKLAAAVSNAGGLGSLGPNAGQTVVTRDPDGTAENMRAEIRKLRAETDKPFSVNVLPVQNGEDIYTPPMLKVIYEEHVPVVTFVGEPDAAMFSEFKAHGIKIVYRSLDPVACTPQAHRKMRVWPNSSEQILLWRQALTRAGRCRVKFWGRSR